jgi:Calcineurin-like phosphoesterase
VTDPEKILVAGDWHGNTRWALNVIWEARTLLADQDPKIIVQLGDFGIWGGEAGEAYLQQLGFALDQADMTLLFADGNHEDHDLIASWREPGYPAGAAVAVPGTMGAVFHLPRGHRWTWHGRTWLACGGAASPDRAWREDMEARSGGKLWWQGEYITPADEARCISGGPADVLVSHDRPARARVSLPPWPRMWAVADRARCDASREAVQRICEGTGVRHVIHGHYHMPFSDEQHDLGYGPVQVAQLNTDGYADNFRVFNTERMEWE